MPQILALQRVGNRHRAGRVNCQSAADSSQCVIILYHYSSFSPFPIFNFCLSVTSARSARGLSLEAYVLETLSYAITLAYAVRNAFPFTTYGENLFLTIQNALITLLIIAYTPTKSRSASTSKPQRIAVTSAGLGLTALALYAVPADALQLLQLTTIPLSLFSKLPQIRQNLRAQSTGQLSAFAVFAQIAGCLARLFTTAQEVGDNLVLAGFALALFLNVVLGTQLWMYWGKADAEPVSEKAPLAPALVEATGAAPLLHAPIASRGTAIARPETPTHRIATPPPRTPSSAGTRKWARKVD